MTAEQDQLPIPNARIVSESIRVFSHLSKELHRYKDMRLENETWRAWFSTLRRCIPSSVTLTTLSSTALPWAGQTWDQTIANQFCYMVSGQMYKMRQGEPARRWSATRRPEWCAAQIISMRRERVGQSAGWEPTLKLLTGSPSGMQTSAKWTRKFCRYLSSRLGFSQRWPSPDRPAFRRYRSPEELVSLRVWVLLDPEDRSTSPAFNQVACTGTLLDWNRTKMDQRDRLKPGFTCPKNQPARLFCWQCPFGFVECKAATHKMNYEFKDCVSCGTEDRAHDPEQSTSMCISCVEKTNLGLPIGRG